MVTFESLVVWMFAFRYYELAQKLDKLLGEGKENKKYAKKLNLVMLINIYFWPTLEAVFYLLVNYNREVKPFNKTVQNFGLLFGLI